jgi:pyridoxamine 5'-phosphate oxidase family protein
VEHLNLGDAVALLGLGSCPQLIYVGGLDPVKTRKFRNVQTGNTKVALVIDDLVSTDPWTPRYLRIYGTAELVDRQGRFGPASYMRITPTISWSWNLDGSPFTHDREVRPRRTVHQAVAEQGAEPVRTATWHPQAGFP